MVVLSPAHRSQTGRAQEHTSQTPKIDRSAAGMATSTLLTQRRRRAGDHAGEPEQDVNSDQGQNTWLVEGISIPAISVVPSPM